MEDVDSGDEAGDGEEEEEKVSAKEVGSKERHLDNLDDELARGLRPGGGSKSSTVPCDRKESVVGHGEQEEKGAHTCPTTRRGSSRRA